MAEEYEEMPRDLAEQVWAMQSGFQKPEGLDTGMPEFVAQAVREAMAGVPEGIADLIQQQLRSIVSVPATKPALQSQPQKPDQLKPDKPSDGPTATSQPMPNQPVKLPQARPVQRQPSEKPDRELLDIVIDIRDILEKQVDLALGVRPEKPEAAPIGSGQAQPSKPASQAAPNPFVERIKNTRLGRIATGFKDRMGNVVKRFREAKGDSGNPAKRVQDFARKQRDEQGGKFARQKLDSLGGKNTSGLPRPTANRIPSPQAVRSGLNTVATRGASSGLVSAGRATAGLSGFGGSAGGAAAGAGSSISAGGAGAAAGGGAAGGAAAAGAVLGPVAVVGAAAVAAGYSMYELAEAGYDLAYQQENAARSLAYAAPQIQAALAQLDAQRTMRDIESGANTQDSYTALLQSISELEQAIRPMKDMLANLSNFAGAATVQALADGVKRLEQLAQDMADMKTIFNTDAFPMFKALYEEAKKWMNLKEESPVGSLSDAAFRHMDNLRAAERMKAAQAQDAARKAHGG
jgi:hypothetical protein